MFALYGMILGATLTFLFSFMLRFLNSQSSKSAKLCVSQCRLTSYLIFSLMHCVDVSNPRNIGAPFISSCGQLELCGTKALQQAQVTESLGRGDLLVFETCHGRCRALQNDHAFIAFQQSVK